MNNEVRERFERTEGRMERMEANLLQVSEQMKQFGQGMNELRIGLNELRTGLNELQAAQLRTEQVLSTLLDALFTQRGNGHSKQSSDDLK